MPEIGNILREARIRKGLSIKDVSDATKIRSKYLEGLEQDDYEVLPGPTYAKAFLRSYAAFLKLDADALVEEYRHSHELRREESRALRESTAQQPRSRTLAERKKRKTRRSQRGYALLGVVAVAVVVVLAYWGSGWGGQPAATLGPGNLETSTSSTGGAGESSTTTGVTGAEAFTTTTSAAVSTGKNVVLVLSVSKDSCWVDVREDNAEGARLFTGTLEKGEEQTFNSAKRYWLRVGIPEVLVLSVNGTPRTLDAPAGDFVVTEAGIEPSQ